MKIKGSAIVEFAFTFPLFFLLFLGSLYLFLNLANLAAVESGLNVAADTLRISSTNYQNKIITEINKKTFIPLTTSDLVIEAVTYPDRDSALQEIGGTPGTGSSGNFVVYKVTYNTNWTSFILN